jgi:hypothetical protein
MNLKNYTSGIAEHLTIARIEKLLVEAGAEGIAKEYKNGAVSAFMFKIRFDKARPAMTVKLPANAESCHEAMWLDYKSDGCNPRKQKRREDFKEQALRTAWKLQQDWLEVQLSLIALAQIEIMQVFLPFVWQNGETFYEALKAKQFKALMPPQE